MTGHYDEEALIELVESGEGAVASDEHVGACRDCADTITSIRQFTETLKSKDVWEGAELNPEPSPQVLGNLAALQARMRAEDAAADGYVKELLAGPRETWMAKLQEHPEWRTAGVVRKLIGATDRAIETMPPDALEMAAVGVAIAEGLEPTRYSAEEIESLRVGALREKAYGLLVTSQYRESLAALSSAEAILTKRVSIDAARLLLVRALVESDLEQFGIALDLTREAASMFQSFGALGKLSAARRTEAIILYRVRRFHDALAIYHALERQSVDRRERAALHQNIALCYRELQSFEVAGRYFASSLREFEALRMPLSAAKARWHFGRVLIAQGRYPAAIDALQQVKEEFSTAGMTHDTAIVTVDIAHAMMISGRTAEVAEVCRTAMAYFAAHDLATSEAAMAALSLLKESAAAGRLNEETFVAARDRLTSDNRKRIYLD